MSRRGIRAKNCLNFAVNKGPRSDAAQWGQAIRWTRSFLKHDMVKLVVAHR